MAMNLQDKIKSTVEGAIKNSRAFQSNVVLAPESIPVWKQFISKDSKNLVLASRKFRIHCRSWATVEGECRYKPLEVRIATTFDNMVIASQRGFLGESKFRFSYDPELVKIEDSQYWNYERVKDSCGKRRLTMFRIIFILGPEDFEFTDHRCVSRSPSNEELATITNWKSR
jgi:hypothetical protein